MEPRDLALIDPPAFVLIYGLLPPKPGDLWVVKEPKHWGSETLVFQAYQLRGGCEEHESYWGASEYNKDLGLLVWKLATNFQGAIYHYNGDSVALLPKPDFMKILRSATTATATTTTDVTVSSWSST